MTGPFDDYAEAVAWLEAWAERARVPVVAVLGDPLFTVVRVGYSAEGARAAVDRARPHLTDPEGGTHG